MGRKCRRKLGNEGRRMTEIILLPFTLFEWIFSLAFWYYGVMFLVNSELYENTHDKIEEKWNAYRNK